MLVFVFFVDRIFRLTTIVLFTESVYSIIRDLNQDDVSDLTTITKYHNEGSHITEFLTFAGNIKYFKQSCNH